MYVVSTPQHATLSVYAPMLIRTFYHAGDALNLPAVVAGAVVAFLLLTLLIVGIIVGAVLLRRKAHKYRECCHRGMHRSRRVYY